MFTKLFRRQTVKSVDVEQLDLDLLRMSYADVPAMQLHCDRMQIALTASRSR